MQPSCAWCGDPAAEQVQMGIRRKPDVLMTSGGIYRLYAWLCGQCANDAKTEKEHSRGQ